MATLGAVGELSAKAKSRPSVKRAPIVVKKFGPKALRKGQGSPSGIVTPTTAIPLAHWLSERRLTALKLALVKPGTLPEHSSIR